MVKSLLLPAALIATFAVPASLIAHAPDRAAEVAPGDGQHYVIHVPRMTITTTTTIVRSRPVAPPPPAPPMVEKKADDCIRMQRVVGFAVTQRDSVDLVMNDGSRMRAKLANNCPSLGFYSGFYVRPNPDGKMCVDRDTIRARSGGSCSISAFKKLVPAK